MESTLPGMQDLTYFKVSRTAISDAQLDERIDKGRVTNAARAATNGNSEEADQLGETQSTGKAVSMNVIIEANSQMSTQTREDLATRRQLGGIVSITNFVCFQFRLIRTANSSSRHSQWG
jgi:hypothetical protein